MLEMILVLVVFLCIGFAWQRGNDRRLKALEQDVLQLRAALAGGPPAPVETPLVDTDAAEGAETIAGPWSAAAADPSPGTAPAPASAATDETDTVAAARPEPRESLESWLGARWAVWVGGLALALGGVFMIKYSIESGLLSPAVRLVIAALFGLLLAAAGELIRRRALTPVQDRFQNAMIPGILTAAGAVTLFGAIYAAHGIYGFIGPGTAFALLTLVALATLCLSLLHGQALAGLGLGGSMLTPLLITTDAANAWTLFGFLSVAWLATSAAARLRGWTLVPALANGLMALWALLVMLSAPLSDLTPVTLAMLLTIAGTLFLWPGRAFQDGHQQPEAVSGETDATPESDSEKPRLRNGWQQLMARPPLVIMLSLALSVLTVALVMAAMPLATGLDPRFSFAVLTTALAGLGASRLHAPIPALVAGFAAVLGTLLVAGASLHPEWLELSTLPVVTPLALTYGADIGIALGLGALFAGLGFAFLRQLGPGQPLFSTLWAALMVVVPLCVATVSFVNFGNLSFDWQHGLFGVALGVFFLAITEWLARDRDSGQTVPAVPALLIAGSFAAFTFALHALSSGVVTTAGVAIIGFAYVAATRRRAWPLLPWMMAAAAVIALGRIAWDPTIVGADHLGTTPVFNALLAGYGIPALLTGLAAYELRRWPYPRIRNGLQALASLMLLLTIAILVRHAMNGGVLAATVPTLGEQSIYTLLTIGTSGVLMSLDLKSPSPVFRWGSMAAGVVSMVSILTTHFIVLNPFFSGETTGRLPFVNLLLIAYLLPAIAYAGLAVYARGKRPPPYVMLLALMGALLGFAWATLSVRRFWQGESIAAWKGFLQGETYSYSVVWLIIGVVLLALGSRFDAKSLRLSSAALVLIAVIKVFLVDMANLEGFLRALSFIGLGAVLIGIGLFYQKILTGKAKAPVQSPTETPT